MKKLVQLLFIGLSIHSFCQSDIIIVPTLTLQNDSIIKTCLIPALNSYLDRVESDNIENQFISTKNKAQNFDLTDEIKGIQKSGKYKSDHFYKPHLINLIPQQDNKYFLQIAFIGTIDSTSLLRANVDLIAERTSENSFVFSSPIDVNTKYWKTKTTGNVTFYFKNVLKIDKANAYFRYVDLFDKKLNNINQSIEYYVCSDAIEVLQILGIQFKSDYNGLKSLVLSSNADQKTVIVSSDGGESFDTFDPHDLWHDRLSKSVSRSLVNKSIDEGCAYLYGGSWGMTWKEILTNFKSKVSNDKQKDWLTIYGKYENFGESQELHLYPEYVINALLVQKIETEKGFPAVIEFLKSGKNEPDDKSNTNYFTALDKLTGINRVNFNQEVWNLMRKE